MRGILYGEIRKSNTSSPAGMPRMMAGLALDRGSSRDRDPMWMDPGKILGARTWIPAVFDQSGSLVGVSRRIPAK